MPKIIKLLKLLGFMWREVVDAFDIELERRVDWRLLRRVRLEKLWDLMEASNLDALLLTLSYNIRYATDFRPLFGPFYVYDRYTAVVPRRGEPILFMTEPEIALGCVKRRMPWIRDSRRVYQFSSTLYAVDKWVGSVREVLEEYGVRGGRVGVDYLSFMVYQRLRDSVPDTEFVPAFTEIAETRMVKHPEELKVMIEAVHVVEIGMREALDHVREGVREYEIGAFALKAMSEAGMEVATHSPSVRAGENAAILQRTATGKRVRSGETVIIDLGAMVSGYCADFCRTTVCGKPSGKQKDMFKALLSAHLTAIQSIRPGLRVSELDRVVRDGIKMAGYPDYPGGTGHGIGMALGEPPVIPPPSEEADIALKPGMVICLEPGIFIPGTAGVKVEDMVLVTDYGAEVLTKTGYEEKLLS